MTEAEKNSPKNTFETALAAAGAIGFQNTLKTADGREFALRPAGFEIKDVTSPGWLAPFAQAKIVVDERLALIDYVNRFREWSTILFANADMGEIVAQIDYHRPPEGAEPACLPGACKHQATLKLRPSEEFARWDAFEGDLHPQAEFARFLEENAVDILHPEAASMIEVAHDLSAAEGVKFSSKVDLRSGNRRFHYENETRVEGDIVIPSRFTLSIPLYSGEAPIELEALFRYRVAPGGLFLGFEWRRVEYLKLAHFKQIAFAIAEGTGAAVFLGRMI